MGRSFTRSASAAWLGTGFVAILTMIAIAAGALLYQERGSDAVRHTLQVDGHLARVLSTIQDAETGQRGFLLTGDEAFLAPFSASVARLTQQLGRLRLLVQDSTAQSMQVDELGTLVRSKLDELETSIALRRGGQAAAASHLVAEGEGKRLMDGIRDLVGRMERHEADLMEQRQAAVSRIALGIWLLVAIVVVLVVVFATSAIREAGRRTRLARFLPAELADRLADAHDTLRTGRRQLATIAFVDMRGSTHLAENLEPERLSEILTVFRSHIADAARRHRGVIDKFIGDGALVVFGLPEPEPDDAGRALAFAHDLVAAIATWSDAEGNDAPVQVGIGLHCGEVFCGLIGEASRCEFTVLGDTVNVAARLEQATKAHGVPVLASAAMRTAAGIAPANWLEISRTPLRGRREAMAYGAPSR